MDEQLVVADISEKGGDSTSAVVSVDTPVVETVVVAFVLAVEALVNTAVVAFVLAVVALVKTAVVELVDTPAVEAFVDTTAVETAGVAIVLAVGALVDVPVVEALVVHLQIYW